MMVFSTCTAPETHVHSIVPRTHRFNFCVLSVYVQFCDDMRLMFDNAWLYNRKTSRVYKYCTKLSEVFEDNIDAPMQSLGYCCGRRVSGCGFDYEIST